MALRVLALIPARSGSRGLRNKNVRKVDGVPMLVRAIHLARASARRAEEWRVVVSTDAECYARLARRAGADVPFLRPQRLATSRARLIDAVLHAVNRLETKRCRFDAVVILSAATPLTTTRDVRAALRMFEQGGHDSVASVVHDPVPAAWRFAIQSDRLISTRRVRVGRRQEATAPYRINGAIYVATPAWLRRHRQVIVPGRTLGMIMPPERSVDVDSALDLAIAGFLARMAHTGRSKSNV